MDERTKKSYKEYYEVLNPIERGAFEIVYKGKEKGKDELRAIKVIDLQKIKENLINELYTDTDLKEQIESSIKGFKAVYEIMKICSLNNENSVKCYEYFNNEDNFTIIMELCDADLSKVLRHRIDKYKKGFNSEEILEILNQLNNAFKVMKENKIVHRDLKLENILIKYKDEEHKKYIIKLNNYDCSKRLSSLTENYLDDIIGTLPYMAPEILKGEKYNYKCDLWSIGIIIYILYFGIFPYRAKNQKAIINEIEQLGKKILKETDNKELDDLIKKLLEKDPSKRLTWDEYFNHPFFKTKKKNYKEYYKDLNVIGYGGFGIVYKGKTKDKDEIRAIKEIDLKKIKENLISIYGLDIEEHLESSINGLKTEFENMKKCSLNNENSVKCYEYFNNEDYFTIIMELCDTNLSQVLTDRILKYKKGFNSEEILEILKQLNKTFKLMKENKIIHRDLKLENILIKYKDKEHKKYIIKLSDYGCSKRLSSLTNNYLKTFTGTLPYMAPEILKHKEEEEKEEKKEKKEKEEEKENYYNYKCDLWSIGIIIYQLYFGTFPYTGQTEIAIIRQIELLGKKKLKETDNKELNDLIKNLLEKDPSKRLTWDEYFNHPFFGAN